MPTMKTTHGNPPVSKGRPPGAKNKSSISKVSEILSNHNLNPVEEILKLLCELEPKDRANIWLHLLKYCEAPALPKQTDDTKAITINYTKPEPE